MFKSLRSIGKLNTQNFLRNNTTQHSKSPDIDTTQNVSVYAIVLEFKSNKSFQSLPLQMGCIKLKNWKKQICSKIVYYACCNFTVNNTNPF